MKRFIRGAAVAVAIIAPAIMSVAPSASAASADVFTQIGSGTISPGLNVTPQPQTFNFAGTGTGAGTGGAAVPPSCNATGNDAGGTLALGEGNTAINCTVGSDSPTVNATFVRVGAVVVVASAGGVVKLGGGVCAFATTQTPPVTNYTLVCAGAYAQNP